MTTASIGSKTMTIGEAILAPLFVVLAFLCLIGAAMAHDTAFAFHASLGCIASLMAAFTMRDNNAVTQFMAANTLRDHRVDLAKIIRSPL
jgi:sugar phosphate permease